MDNGLEDLWRQENPDSSEFTHYDRSLTQDPGKKIANNTKIDHIGIFFTHDCTAIFFAKSITELCTDDNKSN